jgi:hypothetical protein
MTDSVMIREKQKGPGIILHRLNTNRTNSVTFAQKFS